MARAGGCGRKHPEGGHQIKKELISFERFVKYWVTEAVVHNTRADEGLSPLR